MIYREATSCSLTACRVRSSSWTIPIADIPPDCSSAEIPTLARRLDPICSITHACRPGIQPSLRSSLFEGTVGSLVIVVLKPDGK